MEIAEPESQATLPLTESAASSEGAPAEPSATSESAAEEAVEAENKNDA
jgi:hypothetical protein